MELLVPGVSVIADAMHALTGILGVLWFLPCDSQQEGGTLPISPSVAIVRCTLSAGALVVASRQLNYAP
jgi:hypothetical protein